MSRPKQYFRRLRVTGLPISRKNTNAWAGSPSLARSLLFASYCTQKTIYRYIWVVCVREYTHTYIRMPTHRSHPYISVYSCTRVTHSHTHTGAHTYTRMHIHTYVRMHLCARVRPCLRKSNYDNNNNYI